MLALRVVADAPLAQRLERRPSRLLHRAPPLERDQRLDPRVAALAGADRVPVALSLLELVVGSEGEGIRQLVRSKCDIVLKLPMQGKIESLNAAVAGSVALYLAYLARRD